MLGKDDEKPAFRHGRQKPKPVTEKTIHVSIKVRMEELEPVVAEVKKLEEALDVLKDI